MQATPRKAPLESRPLVPSAHKELALLSLLTEFLDWVLIFGRRHLRSALSECVDHYNRSRPHRSLDLTAPEPCERDSGSASDVRVHRRVQLGGLINELLRGRVMHDRVSVPHLDYLPAAIDEGVNSELRLLRRLLPRPRSRP